MSVNTAEADSTPDTTESSRSDVLEMARQLDRFGRRAEQFLSFQLQLLERSIDEFEQEKLAWRRQQQREQSQLEKLRQEVALERRSAGREGAFPGLRGVSRLTTASGGLPEHRELAPATPEELARQSSVNPIRILMHPGSAGADAIASWMFEFSRLSLEIGGGGTRFEIVESRLPPRRLFGRRESGVIVELDAFSCLSLTEAATQGTFEVDKSEHLECWIAFKSQLLQSSLIKSELETAFRDSRIEARHMASRTLMTDAIRQAAQATLNGVDEHRHLRTAFRVSHGIDSVRQQLERLESRTETLLSQHGFRVHVSLR